LLQPTYYQLLGVLPGATSAQIKAGFKAMAVKYHPDKHGGDKSFEGKFKQINEAYQILSDPRKKHLYDLKLQYAQAVSQRHTMAPNSPYQASHIFRQQARHASYNPQQGAGPRPAASRPAQPKPKMASRQPLFRTYTLRELSIIGLVLAGLSVFGLITKFTMDHITAVDRYESALGSMEEQRWAAAYGYLTEALYFKPTYGEAYLKKGDIDLMIYRAPKQALEDYNYAFQYLDQIPVQSYYMRAKSHLQLQHYKAADQDLSTVIRKDSTLALASLDRAFVRLHYLQEPKLSIRDFNRFLNYATDSSLMAQAWRYRGYARQQTGQRELAIADYQRALRTEPDDAWTYTLLGEAYLAQGDSVKACRNFAQAYHYSTDKSDAEAWLQYCWSGRKK
jgi:tetratricopeptide (TPR) repeat protein